MCRKMIYLVSFILVLSVSSSVCADLVGHWKLDDGSGTTITDISGNGNDGPSWTIQHGISHGFPASQDQP